MNVFFLNTSPLHSYLDHRSLEKKERAYRVKWNDFRERFSTSKLFKFAKNSIFHAQQKWNSAKTKANKTLFVW